jgi:hypothetical protein
MSKASQARHALQSIRQIADVSEVDVTAVRASIKSRWHQMRQSAAENRAWAQMMSPGERGRMERGAAVGTVDGFIANLTTSGLEKFIALVEQEMERDA